MKSETTLQENKAALIIAHRAQDWEAAKRLSQEKQRLKKEERNRCTVCGVPLQPRCAHEETPVDRRCRVHQKHLRSVKLLSRARLAPALLLLLVSTLAASSPQFLSLTWDNQQDVDVWSLYSTTDLSIAPTKTVVSTNSIGVVSTNVVPNWPMVAQFPGSNNFGAVLSIPGQRWYYVTGSNAWGEALPSNLLRLPNPSSVVSNVKLAK